MEEIRFEEIDHVLTNTISIKSLSEYISAVNHISHQFNDKLWFRGHSNYEYRNLPSIYRKETWSDYAYYDEFEIFKEFKRECKLQRSTDYEYLHLMQHFGLPTRLLDWTESSLIALFFAIHNGECNQPTVWIIDPRDFNYTLHKDQTIFYFYGNSVHPKIDNYLNPEECVGENLPSLPIAVLPSFYDDRVIAQKSGFILFGKDKVSIEELVKRDHYFNMARINIDTLSIKDILIDLNIAGINYYTVFPDLYGLVQKIKNKWEIK